MFNSVMNSSMKWLASTLLRRYRHYPADQTAVILIDVQDEFLSPESYGWTLIQAVSTKIGFLDNLRELISLSRLKAYPIIYAPYNENISGSFLTPIHRVFNECFEKNKENNERKAHSINMHMDLQPKECDQTMSERAGLSIFANTTLDEKLRSKGIEHLVFAGPMVNTNIDSSVRDAVELGYHSTLISDCVSAFSDDEYDAATKITFPRFCQTVVTLDGFRRLVS